MDVVTLNEQLREEFACVVKRFIRYQRERVLQVALASQASSLANLSAPMIASEAQGRLKEVLTKPEVEPQMENGVHLISNEEPVVNADTAIQVSTTEVPTADEATSSSEIINHVTSSDESSSIPESTTATIKPGLLTPTSVTILPPVNEKSSDDVAPSILSTRIDHYFLHAKEILQRINLYQYTSRHQFAIDLQTLHGFAVKPAERMMIEHLLKQQQGLAHDAEIKAATVNPTPVKRVKVTKVNGIRLRPAMIRGIQELRKGSWSCNLNLLSNNATIGVYSTEDEALQGYERMRHETRENRWGVKALHKLAQNMAQGQEAIDSRVLQNAVNQCKQHMTSQRLKEFSYSLPQPELVAPIVEKPPKLPKERVKPLQPSQASVLASARMNRRGKTPHDKTIGRLRLRRLLQMRLCKHVEGKEVYVRPSGAAATTEDATTWKATGLLEDGRVLYYKYQPKRHITFSEYVSAELGWTAAACDHIYLVETKQSLDTHLLSCDAFDATIRRVVEYDFKLASAMWLDQR